ncbi:hypothetical protein Salat_1900800 [Sesamum alatum]|uniref:Transposase (putative) gypsy type domain-containing protein n=1 Tax=Sesamum alatum TaxID=300844 RepID=A0AAE1Y3Y1_9LAMI|nr:hypothetical protein Salat_1900800 [Sesamum alatum]
MESGYTTSDWTSSDYASSSSPPPTSRSLPQKVRGKMTRHTRASSSKEPSPSVANEISPHCFAVISSISSKMSTKSIVKTINLLGLPEGYEVLTPIEYQWANNPQPECLTVYAVQCVSGLRFPLHPFLVELLSALGIQPNQLNPNSYRLVVGFLLCCQLYHIEPSLENFLGEWEVPLAWRSSLNELLTINFESVKERVKAAGLLDHDFKAKALVEKDLLIVAGLHPEPATYTGLESQTMMNRAVVRKFLPENLPANPLSSSSTRSASATPSEIQSSGRGRSPSRTPSVVRPSSTSPNSVPSQHADVPSEMLVIEVETSPEADTTPTPSSPPFVLLSEVGSSFQKRPHLEDVPQGEEPSPADPAQAAPPSFPLPVMTPQFNPKAGVSNMCKVVNKGDVESLSGRSMEGMGHLLLSHTAMTPAIIVAMIERYDKMRANLEAALSQLKGARAQRRRTGGWPCKRLKWSPFAYISLVVFEGSRRGLAGWSVSGCATFKASPEYAEEIFRQGSSFYADGFTVCAEQFKNLGNLSPDFDFNFLDMCVDGFGRIGGVGPSE